MTTFDWVVGTLFRPAATFEYAREHLRFGYWWIFLGVLTVEAVTLRYAPVPPDALQPTGLEATIFAAIFLLLLFNVQSVLFRAAAGLFGWALHWAEAVKYVGVTWSVLLIEDLAGFYPALKNQEQVVLYWVGIPFALWHLVAFTAGVKRVTGLSLAKALLLTAIATLPWRALLYGLHWYFD